MPSLWKTGTERTEMTMPKFEPVAKVLVIDEVGRELVFNLQKPLHTADQLTEAYEAGKREASEDIEQAAFEKWLYDKCPSGDVESVQRQWLESYEYAELAGKMEQAALNERDAIKREWDKAYEIAMLTKQQLAEAQQTIERQAAQIEMMRDFIETAPVSTGVCCCGESMEGHSSPMNCGHTPVDLWDHSVISVLSATPDQALEQFAANVREQCAKVCENEYSYTVFHTDQRAAINCANAIRASKELP